MPRSKPFFRSPLLSFAASLLMGLALLAVLVQCRKQEEAPALKPPGSQAHRANPQDVAREAADHAAAVAASAAESKRLRMVEESNRDYAKTLAALKALNASTATDTLGYELFRDSVTALIGSPPDLDMIRQAALSHISLKDSIERVIGSEEITDPKDSAVLMPSLEKGFGMMMAYRRLLAYGIPLPGGPPKLARKENVADSLARKFLPKIAPSDFLTDGRFFFLGAGPFLTRRSSDDYDDSEGRTYVDSHGKPEIRYFANANHNTHLLVDVVRRMQNPRMQIEFGPPLRSYDTGPIEVNDIGTLIHELAERLPVLFLTEKGVVPAGLISITVKIADESRGCVSDNPEVQFATASLPKSEILGVFIPYDPGMAVSCAVTRGKNHWTADLDNDGIPELACISESFVGIVGETLASLTWYANIGGVWTLIDSAADPDCT